MKGIVLAGVSDARLYPLTKEVSKLLLLLCFCVLLTTACEDVPDNAVLERGYFVDQGDTIRVHRLFCENMDSNYPYEDTNLTAQGAAIYDNHLYRIYDYGYCKVFRLDQIYTTYESEFKLKSFHKGNHANCAQIDKATGLLYESEYYERICNVEKVSRDGSVFIQAIRIEKTDKLGDGPLNIVKGDDGFLWAFGCSDDYRTLSFFKFKSPSTDSPEVILSDIDIIDSWTDYTDFFMQGGKVRNGYLYFLSGSANSCKKIMIYDISSKQLLRSIDLNEVIIEEPEDCDIIDDKLIITVYGSNAYYVLYIGKIL